MREMKDSGIEWIKQIPTGWSTTRGKNILQLMKRPPEADDEVITCFRDGEVTLRRNRREEGFTFSDKEIGYQGIKKGDLVVHGMDGFAGAIGISDSDGKGSPVLVVCTTKENTRYLMYYLRTLALQDVFLALATGIRERSCDLRWNKIADLLFPVPELNEQCRIVDYLDRKCSQIDAIIARQQEVIEKLKAYKLSIITEAVTKGLNPDVPMKDSGVEWIGEIPDHWRLIKLKNIVGISDGTHDTPAYVDISETSHPLVTSKCIVNGKIDPSLGNHISQDDYDEINKRSKVHLYDVIMPMIGTVGNPALVLEEPNFAIKNVALLKTRGSLELGKFVLYLLSSNLATVQFDKINRGGVQSFISQEKLKNMIFTLPDSMSEIVVFLDKKIAAIDNVIKQKQMLIDKLVDWKKSLIYEVVTGKKEVKV